MSAAATANVNSTTASAAPAPAPAAAAAPPAAVAPAAAPAAAPAPAPAPAANEALDKQVNRFLHACVGGDVAPAVDKTVEKKATKYRLGAASAASLPFVVEIDKFANWQIDFPDSAALASYCLDALAVRRFRAALAEVEGADLPSKGINAVWINFKLPFTVAAYNLFPADTVFVESVDAKTAAAAAAAAAPNGATSNGSNGHAAAGDRKTRPQQQRVVLQDLQLRKLRVYRWLNPQLECTVPAAATHNVGASALVHDPKTNLVLLAKHKMRGNKWMLPGGSFDLAKDKRPQDAAARELLEEVGVSLDGKRVESLLATNYFPDNQMAMAVHQVWGFSLDGCSAAKPHGSDEIEFAEWLDLDQVLAAGDKYRDLEVGAELRFSLNALKHNKGFTVKLEKPFMQVYAP